MKVGEKLNQRTRITISCNHKWKCINEYIGWFNIKRYVLQCKHCGDIKRK